MFDFIISAIVITLSFLLLYASLFVYPDERDQIHNRLEDLWLSLSETSGEYESKTLMITKRVGIFFTAVFNKYFGQSLLSKRSVMSSLVLSAWLSPMLVFYVVSIVVLFVDLRVDAFERPPVWPVWIAVLTVLFAVYCRWIFRGIVRKDFIQKYSGSLWGYLRTFAMILVFGPASVIIVVLLERDGVTTFSILLSLALVLTLVVIVLLSDLVSIYITRRILGYISRASHTIFVGGAYALDALTAILCASYPSLFLFAESISGFPISGFPVGEYLYILGIAALMMNVTTLAPTIAYLACTFLVVANTLTWPLLLRPIYSLIDNCQFAG